MINSYIHLIHYFIQPIAVRGAFAKIETGNENSNITIIPIYMYIIVYDKCSGITRVVRKLGWGFP